VLNSMTAAYAITSAEGKIYESITKYL
jgi:hypothetical protein